MKNFLSIFQQYIDLSDILVIGVSGGVDSMVLLNLLLKSHPKESLVVAHFDHMLRWGDSDRDREFVMDFCQKNNLIFEFDRVDIGEIYRLSGGSLEAIARAERYGFLEKVREKYQAKYIITAHHSDDQIETILLNLIKWWKIQWLSGMSILSWTLFRPLLFEKKSEILKYAHDFQIPYYEDVTNGDMDFDRNKIRHQILPVLEEMNPSIHRTIENLASYMQELNQFFDHQCQSWLDSSSRNTWVSGSFQMTDFLDLDRFFQKELIVSLYRSAHDGSSQGLSTGLIDEILRYISTAHWSTQKDIHRLSFSKKWGTIFYSRTHPEK